MLRISRKAFSSGGLIFQYPLFEDKVSLLFSVFGLRTKRSCSFFYMLDDKAAIIRGSSFYVNKVLRQDPKYVDLFYDVRTVPPELENKCESIKILKRYFENPCADTVGNLQKLLDEELPQLTYEETLYLLHWFLKCCKTNSKKVKWVQMGVTIKSHLDSITNKNRNKIFQSLDIFFSNPSKNLHFTFFKTLRKILEKVESLSPQQFVLGCKYGIHLKNVIMIPKINNYFFDKKLIEILPDLTLNELEVVSGFFCFYKYFFSHVSGRLILHRLCENIENPDAFHYHCIMKVLCKRKVFYLNNENFEEKIISKISNLNYLSLINLFYLEIFCKNSQKLIVQEMIKKCNENFNECSLTTLQRVLEAMTRFNFCNETFIGYVTKSIEKILEGPNSIYYASFMLNSLYYFVNLQIYPEKVIKSLISENFCKTLFKPNLKKVLRNWGFIYYSLEIENPKLSTEISETTKIKLDKILKYYKSPLTLHSSSCKFAYKVEDILKKMYGPHSFVWTRVLPHYKPTHVLRFSKNFESLTIPLEFMSQKEFEIKKPTDTDSYWICIFTENSSAIIDDNKLSTILLTQIRQFNFLGYEVLHIQRKDFDIRTFEEKAITILREKINSVLANIAK